jgi:hypothetical protein
MCSVGKRNNILTSGASFSDRAIIYLNVLLDLREEIICEMVWYFAVQKLNFAILIRRRVHDHGVQINVMQKKMQCCFHCHCVNDTLFGLVHILFNQ